MPRPVANITYDMLYNWQKEIVDLFKEPEDALFGRHIYWYWEPKGNIGKSIISKYLIDNTKCMCVSGAGSDIKYGIQCWIEKYSEGPEIIVCDIPRVSNNHISYQALESIKNGFFFSGKYESGMVRFNSPHIICFANHPPGYDVNWEDSDDEDDDRMPELHYKRAEKERGKILSEDRWIVTQLDITKKPINEEELSRLLKKYHF